MNMTRHVLKRDIKHESHSMIWNIGRKKIKSCLVGSWLRYSWTFQYNSLHHALLWIIIRNSHIELLLIMYSAWNMHWLVYSTCACVYYLYMYGYMCIYIVWSRSVLKGSHTIKHNHVFMLIDCLCSANDICPYITFVSVMHIFAHIVSAMHIDYMKNFTM